MKFIFMLICLPIATAVFSQKTIYSFELDSVAGNSQIDFSVYAGKKILVVNTASQDSSFTQYEELKQLAEIYKETLVIIVCPTNSFSTENGNGSQLAAAYNLSAFPVSSKVKVTGAGIHPLYQWLTNASHNGRMNSQVTRPFFKFLISATGEFLGVFSPRITPMHTILRTRIESTN